MTTTREVLRQPSALAPLIIAAAALGLVAAQLVRFGTAPQPDETAYARLWQLLMVLELPAIALFALRWVPAAPRAAARVLALQAAAVVLAVTPIAMLGW